MYSKEKATETVVAASCLASAEKINNDAARAFGFGLRPFALLLNQQQQPARSNGQPVESLAVDSDQQGLDSSYAPQLCRGSPAAEWPALPPSKSHFQVLKVASHTRFGVRVVFTGARTWSKPLADRSLYSRLIESAVPK